MAYTTIPASSGGGAGLSSFTATPNTGLAISGTLTDPVIAGIASSASVPGTMSAANFTKLAAMALLASGTDLTDASATIQPGTDAASQYNAAVNETANRSTALGVTSAFNGQVVYIYRTSTAAFTRAITNGGTTGGTLFTFPASQTKGLLAGFAYNGTDWVALPVAYMA